MAVITGVKFSSGSRGGLIGPGNAAHCKHLQSCLLEPRQKIKIQSSDMLIWSVWDMAAAAAASGALWLTHTSFYKLCSLLRENSSRAEPKEMKMTTWLKSWMRETVNHHSLILTRSVVQVHSRAWKDWNASPCVASDNVLQKSLMFAAKHKHFVWVC